jgi:predicted Zn-dependent protease
MKKSLLQGIIIGVLFLSIWTLLTEVNWVKLFKIEQATQFTEEKLGDIFWEVIKQSNEEITDTTVVQTIDNVFNRIAKANTIERSKIKLHILKNEEVNAFALPNGHLVIYTGLIVKSKKPEEMAGVLSHELAHIELKHIMKKLISEMGLSVLINISTGNTNSETIKKMANILSSSAFERALEKEADIKALEYMIQARINPRPFAHFLYRLSLNEDPNAKYLEWVSSHPISKDRSKYINAYLEGKTFQYSEIITQANWITLQNSL